MKYALLIALIALTSCSRKTIPLRKKAKAEYYINMAAAHRRVAYKFADLAKNEMDSAGSSIGYFFWVDCFKAEMMEVQKNADKAAKILLKYEFIFDVNIEDSLIYRNPLTK